MNRFPLHAFAVALLALVLARAVHAQETVVVEQRVLLQDQLTPAAAKHRALEEAMAEAVRRVGGIRVQSSAVSTTTEDRKGVGGEYRSVVQLDASGRATDVRVLSEAWETTHAPGLGDQVYYRATFAVTVERETGTPDASFTVSVVLPRPVFVARSDAPRANDELVARVSTSAAARLFVFSVVEDSVHRLVPNDYLGAVEVATGTTVEVPEAAWRERGLHFRVTLPADRQRRDELLAVVALRTQAPLPPVEMTVLEFQRWLVRLPVADRAIGWAPYAVERGR